MNNDDDKIMRKATGTPSNFAKQGTEHCHQVAVFAYCAVAHRRGFDFADEWDRVGSSHLIAFPDDLSAPAAVPALEWIHAIPNGGARGDEKRVQAIRGNQLKAEGVRSGIADIFLPWPAWIYNSHGDVALEIAYCGLYIEMKKPMLRPITAKSKGGLSNDQIAFGKYATDNNYGWITCYDWREAVNAIRSYVEYKG